MEPETYIHVNLNELKTWQKLAEDAGNPKVPFSQDHATMQKQAYEERGAALKRLSLEMWEKLNPGAF